MQNSLFMKSARFYKIRNAKKEFLCALCRAPRQMSHTAHLSAKNYLQLFLIALTFALILFPVFGFKSSFVALAVWPAGELINKLLYRREVACPYCGFDAIWYRRDVRIARKKVEEFMSKNYPELVQAKQDMDQALASGQLGSQASDEVEKTA